MWITLLGARCLFAFEPPVDEVKVSLGYHYSTGSYGGTGTTEIAYIPLALRADRGAWSAQLTIPYLRIDGPPGTVNGPSGPVQTNDGHADGLGDVLLRGSYTLLPPIDWMPYSEIIGRLKIPTASRSDGLGSGELDYGIELELSKPIGDWTPFTACGYRILGSPPGVDYRNVFLATVGLLYRPAASIDLGLFLDYRDAASSASATRLELVPFVSWKLSDHWRADLYASAGLAEGSPDAGTGLQIAWRM